ncbi:unnamed protein product [Leptosia nina]|uniref:Uncharacterized protein n=1 Tax=Leptosia nina TaxID=320188 RepID=A0AAV1IW08_9NEOP
MESSKKTIEVKAENRTVNNSPWNILFNSRQRTNSENSITSNCSNTSSESGAQFPPIQKQATKTEDYLWMIWRS